MNIDIPTLILFAITIILYGIVFCYIITLPRKHMKVIRSNKFSVKTKLQMFFSIAVRTPSINTIVYILFSLFALTWASLLLAGSIIHQELSGETYMAFVTAISSPILGFCGQVQYIRDETPGRIWDASIQGPFAKLIGGTTMLIGYGGSIVSLIYGLVLWGK